MALRMAIETEHGINLPESYIRIDEQSGGKPGISLRVRFYVSQDKALSGKQWLQEQIISFSPSVEDGSSNFIEQGYEYLKSLPDFSNAIDA